MPTVSCGGCGSRIPREEASKFGLSWFCDRACFKEWSSRRRPKAASKSARPRWQDQGALRRQVRERDGERCRWCRRAAFLECHHVHYRSEGGPDVAHNLVLLCSACHATVHSDKGRWKPVLLALLWIHYTQGVFLLVPQVTRLLEPDSSAA